MTNALADQEPQALVTTVIEHIEDLLALEE